MAKAKVVVFKGKKACEKETEGWKERWKVWVSDRIVVCELLKGVGKFDITLTLLGSVIF